MVAGEHAVNVDQASWEGLLPFQTCCTCQQGGSQDADLWVAFLHFQVVQLGAFLVVVDPFLVVQLGAFLGVVKLEAFLEVVPFLVV